MRGARFQEWVDMTGFPLIREISTLKAFRIQGCPCFSHDILSLADDFPMNSIRAKT